MTPSRFRRRLWQILRIVLLAYGVLAVLLFLVQRSLLYHPTAYAGPLPAGLTALAHETADGRQVAFWLPLADGGSPERIWVASSGNADVGLSWYDLAQQVGDRKAGWLFLDHPGFGASAGSPSLAASDAAAQGAMNALATHLGLDETVLWQRTGVVGHSLGSAVVLRLAAGRPVRAAVLASPFTTMRAMAIRAVGWPLAEVLIDRWDNMDAIRRVRAGSATAAITVLHGADDEIIPSFMGEAVAQAGGATFERIPGCDHNSIREIAGDRLLTALRKH